MGSPNVTDVLVSACWNEEQAKMVLNAIGNLKKVETIAFSTGWRRWRKEEVENFVRRTNVSIRRLSAFNVEESLSPSSAPSVSGGLQLSPGLTSLLLQTYPPLPTLSLPPSLLRLSIFRICPLPASISNTPLSPLLEHLSLKLSPFSADRNVSILPAPLNLSHLTQLTTLSC
ncbi:hypothetical protein BT69DRAFT_1334788 [Atractiella rhizophila]|nr:hypothetical protein BT69DRAFT_1334788 [Atractiella rhizophila]